MGQSRAHHPYFVCDIQLKSKKLQQPHVEQFMQEEQKQNMIGQIYNLSGNQRGHVVNIYEVIFKCCVTSIRCYYELEMLGLYNFENSF